MPPNIAILGMGGTIDKDYPRTTNGYAFEIDEPAARRIFEGMPIHGLGWRVESICRKDSTEIVAGDRKKLIAAIRKAPEKRIIVTHGTDTLIETAQEVQASGVAADKVIAFTGSMKPERFKDSDAAFNIGGACAVTDLLPRGVVVVMGGCAMPADRCVRNLQTGAFEEAETSRRRPTGGGETESAPTSNTKAEKRAENKKRGRPASE